MRTLYADRVVLGGGASPLAVGPATITIDDGRIVAIAEGERSGEVDDDLGDMIVAPAFINAHTHLSMVAFRGLITHKQLRGNVVEELFFRLETALQAEDVRAFTRLGAYESLRHGVARVWDHYYFAEAVAEGMADVGLRGVVAPTLQDLGGPGCEQREAQLVATEALTQDRYASRGIHAALGPHATDTVSESLWTELCGVASRLDLPVHVHVAQSVEEYQRIDERHGCSPIAWLDRIGVLQSAPRLLAIHSIFVSDDDLRRLDATRHTLGYCPLSAQQFCFPAHITSWEAAGLPWIVGTDCAVSNDAMNVQRELPAVAGVRGYAPSSGEAYAAFRGAPTAESATRTDHVRIEALDAARDLLDPASLLSRVWSIPGALHPAVKTGVIETGAEADLIVLDPNHPALWPARDVLRGLAFCDTSSALEGVMVGGRWRVNVGEMHMLLRGPDYADALREANERLERLLGHL